MCRGGCYRGSRGDTWRPGERRNMNRRPRGLCGLASRNVRMAARRAGWVLCAVLLSACGGAAKPVIEPVPPGAPKFADFVFPAAPPDFGPADLLDAHSRAWQFLQAGDTREADRDFTSILKISPSFYPAETGLGYSAFAR